MTDTAPAGPADREDLDAPAGVEVFDAPPAVPGSEPAELAAAEDPPADARPAHPAMRAFAFFLDGSTTFVIVVVVIFAGLSDSGMNLFWAIPLVPFAATLLATALTALLGVTPGKAVLGLRVVDADSGAPVGFGRAILRSLVIVAPIALGAACAAVLAKLPDVVQDAFGGGFVVLVAAIPIAGWIALLVMLATRPRHRGLQDLAGRSVVVRR